MANWDYENLPEEHELIKNVSFITKVKDTWKTKDGTMRDKWALISQETEQSPSFKIETFSSTDNESIELNTAYDVIVKKTPYGSSLKGFALAGTPIAIKESTSRYEKNLKQNNKASALQAVCTLMQGHKDLDEVLNNADMFLAWLNGDYEPNKVDLNTLNKQTDPFNK